mmetsp:Transcript_17985/g.37669  ORF Transcript_17985/g.37669 Transcript_17985/m.37669 type:complete len:81 (+) Transcript_17985:675-917(+)
MSGSVSDQPRVSMGLNFGSGKMQSCRRGGGRGVCVCVCVGTSVCVVCVGVGGAGDVVMARATAVTPSDKAWHCTMALPSR